MRVYIEFQLENWEEFKALIEYLMAQDKKTSCSNIYQVHTAGELNIEPKKKAKV